MGGEKAGDRVVRSLVKFVIVASCAFLGYAVASQVSVQTASQATPLLSPATLASSMPSTQSAAASASIVSTGSILATNQLAPSGAAEPPASVGVPSAIAGPPSSPSAAAPRASRPASAPTHPRTPPVIVPPSTGTASDPPDAGGSPSQGTVRFTIDASGSSYRPARIEIAQGTTAELTFTAASPCLAIVEFPEIGIRQDITKGGVIILSGLKRGDYSFRCWMNMAKGTVSVR